LVEDNPDARMQLSALFEEHFRHVYQAADGQEALELYHTHAPDIILADITMPVMDGLEMARRIKAEAPQQAIVFLTGRNSTDHLLAAANIPADGYITKPIDDIDRLFARLLQAADKIHHIRAHIDDQIQRLRIRYQSKLQTLHYRSHYDALTRIPNRYLFEDHLAKTIENARQTHSRVALMYLDLDRLKPINDRYGHTAGDHVIQTVTQRIREALDPEEMLARIGGDEFAVVIETAGDRTHLEGVVRSLLEASSRSITFEGKTLQTTCSIGVALYPDDARDVPELIAHADRAMYRAKASGKNRYHFWGD
jgi:diguanylate cyclase (GGDEF)-like protein